MRRVRVRIRCMAAPGEAAPAAAVRPSGIGVCSGPRPGQGLDGARLTAFAAEIDRVSRELR